MPVTGIDLLYIVAPCCPSLISERHWFNYLTHETRLSINMLFPSHYIFRQKMFELFYWDVLHVRRFNQWRSLISNAISLCMYCIFLYINPCVWYIDIKWPTNQSTLNICFMDVIPSFWENYMMMIMTMITLSKYTCNRNWDSCHFIPVYSQQVSAPTSHLQVKYNITYTFRSTVIAARDPLFFDCHLLVWVYLQFEF
jgi:hypothetical protein